ncbi:hypothetical protein EVC45_41375 [Paraburkholderia sp. UYCP14C]|nr:hypothetical protein EVC45_41375 [Paraburkholderia sp. UYCP14C]
MAEGFEHIVSRKAADAIRAHSRHGDLDVIWLLPEVVRMEREYQMRNAFRMVLKPTLQAERLLGENWNVSQERIHAAIDAQIQAQLTELDLRVMRCDPVRVDWPELTRRSAFRLPPFQHGETEKGFRDAILCETFCQLVDSLSGKATAVLVSKDGLVGTAVNERTSGTRIVATSKPCAMKSTFGSVTSTRRPQRSLKQWRQGCCLTLTSPTRLRC